MSGGRNTRKTDPLPRGVELHGGKLRIAFMYQGVRCRESLGLEPTKQNIAWAASKRALILHQINTGSFSYAEHFPDSNRVALFGGAAGGKKTVRESLVAYLAAVRHSLAPSTYDEYRRDVERHVLPHLGDTRIRNLSTVDIRAWVGMLAEQLSPKRVNNITTPLRRMLADAYADNVIDRDPMAGRVHNLKLHKPPPDPFEPKEVLAIIGAAEGQDRNYVITGFGTGMRAGEQIALTWPDVDFKRMEISVDKAMVRGVLKSPKSRAGTRTITMSADVAAALKDQKALTYMKKGGKGQVFLHRGKPFTHSNKVGRYIWEPLVGGMALRYRPAKQMRHTYASTLLSKGANPAWLAKQLGHENMVITLKVYARWIDAANPSEGRHLAGMFE